MKEKRKPLEYSHRVKHMLIFLHPSNPLFADLMTKNKLSKKERLGGENQSQYSAKMPQKSIEM